MAKKYKLINSEFGNFILQTLFFFRDFEALDELADFVSSQILELSKKKFSSNVVEKVVL